MARFGKEGLATVAAGALGVGAIVTPPVQSWWLAGPCWVVAAVAAWRWWITAHAERAVVSGSMPEHLPASDEPGQAKLAGSLSLATTVIERKHGSRECHLLVTNRSTQSNADRVFVELLDTIPQPDPTDRLGYIEPPFWVAKEPLTIQPGQTKRVPLATIQSGEYSNTSKPFTYLAVYQNGSSTFEYENVPLCLVNLIVTGDGISPRRHTVEFRWVDGVCVVSDAQSGDLHVRN